MNSRDHADVKVAAPILLTLHLAAALLLDWLLPWPAVMAGWLRWAGLLMAALGGALGILAVLRLYQHRTAIMPHDSVKAIVTVFPFSLSRNPIYLGFIPALIGLSLALGSLWGLPLTIPFVLLTRQLVIQPEEDYLTAKFGEEYTRYTSRVRRWI